MENCFRFLINVDQCMNMSYFDMFFYRLESQHKFHMNSVQLFGNCADSSLRSAISDIRMYLNKYPYHVGSYQIIVAMRSVFNPSVLHWEETMLYRLLHLDHELRRAHILINSREQTEKALNLIMLYDADFSAELPQLENYKDSRRLQDDCLLLLDHLTMTDGPASQEALEQALAARLDKAPFDATAAELLQQFLEKRRKNHEHLQTMAEHMDSASFQDMTSIPLAAELAQFIRDLLFNFQIFEAQVDRNSLRQQTLALLRVTEFINMTTELPEQAANQPIHATLSQRCADNWNRIWQDPELEQRYADMLLAYRTRLNTAAVELESSRHYPATAKDLPEKALPGENDIDCEDSIFSKSKKEDQENDLKRILGRFLEKGLSHASLLQEWEDAYSRGKKLLEQMEHALKLHAESLSRKYAAALEARKQDSIAWKNGFYISGPTTEDDISRLAYERDQRLQQLKSPHMTPSLSFQDQLNMENALEQANLTVKFYLRCLTAVTAGNFLLLVGICVLLCTAHYTFLQPYVFQETQTALCYLVYLAAVLVLMLLCWILPHNYFRRRLKSCIKQLQEDADKYISGYYAKAEHFTSYINLLNQLDYITRYHRLLVKAHAASHKLSQGYLWHKVQVRQHLGKLQFFQGLIELGRPRADDAADSLVPDIDGDQVSDYVDSQVYWPQS